MRSAKTMAAKKRTKAGSKKPRSPQPGDVFATPLEDGKVGAIRVLKKIHRTSCVMVTAYVDTEPPALDDPRLRRVQRYTWWETSPQTPCVSWYEGNAPPELTHVGVLEPNAAEKRLGGKDAGYGYSGRWSAGMGWEALWGWRHENDPERLAADLARS